MVTITHAHLYSLSAQLIPAIQFLVHVCAKMLTITSHPPLIIKRGLWIVHVAHGQSHFLPTHFLKLMQRLRHSTFFVQELFCFYLETMCLFASVVMIVSVEVKKATMVSPVRVLK